MKKGLAREAADLEKRLLRFKFIDRDGVMIKPKVIKKYLNNKLVSLYNEYKNIRMAYEAYIKFLNEGYVDVIRTFEEEVNYLNKVMSNEEEKD